MDSNLKGNRSKTVLSTNHDLKSVEQASVKNGVVSSD